MNILPKVTIVITAFSRDAKPYLDILVESINNLDYQRAKLSKIIVSPAHYAPTYEGFDTISPDYSGNYSNAHAINIGVKYAPKDTDFIFYLNDDVILTRECLSRMITVATQIDNLILMPISNDQQMKYYAFTSVIGPYRYGQIVEHKERLMNEASPYPPGLFFFDALCTYAALFSKKLFDDVGGMEERFVKAGPDDIDFCLRAKAKGYQPAISLDALVWHAGGATSELTLSAEDRVQNVDTFQDKWDSGKEKSLRDLDFIGE